MSCSIGLKTGNHIPVYPAIIYPGELNSPIEQDYYTFEVGTYETVTFDIIINSGVSINSILRIYKYENEEYVELGISYLKNTNNVIRYDAEPRRYYFCITSIYQMSYFMELSFTDYASFQKFFPLAHQGSFIQPFELYIPEPEEIDCEIDFNYRLIKGELPNYLKLDGDSGVISGHIDDLDNLRKSILNHPSWELFDYDDEKDQYFATTLNIPLVIRAYRPGDEDFMHIDGDFTLCIYNNWSKERNAMILSKENMEQKVYLKSSEITTKFLELSGTESDENTEIDSLTEDQIEELERYALYVETEYAPEEIELPEPVVEEEPVVKLPKTLCPPCVTDTATAESGEVIKEEYIYTEEDDPHDFIYHTDEFLYKLTKVKSGGDFYFETFEEIKPSYTPEELKPKTLKELHPNGLCDDPCIEEKK
jgi:hypothetical protein